jgi:hypothetical protein
MMDSISDTNCPTCGEYFDRMYKQHAHAAETGHGRSEYCGTRWRGVFCAREKFHPGACEGRTYGGQSSAFWDSPIQKAMRATLRRAEHYRAHGVERPDIDAMIRGDALSIGKALGYDMSDGWIADGFVKSFWGER